MTPKSEEPREATVRRLDNIDKHLHDIFGKLEENGKKLTYINGDVNRSKGDIVGIKKRLRSVENNEILQEGIEKGKGFMKTSTRNTIIIVIMALGCLFAGIKTFQNSQKELVALLSKNPNAYSADNRIQRIEDSVDMLKHLMTNGGGK